MKKYLAFFALPLLTFSHAALAAKVSAVKNNKIMMELEGTETTSVGSEFFVINAQGKKVALVKVTQIKGARAIAEISKGTAKVGYGLQARGGTAPSENASMMKTSPSADETGGYYEKKLKQRVHNGNSWGILGGYMMNTMTVSTSRINAGLDGTGFALSGYYNYAYSPSITLRGMAGYENYQVNGENKADSPANCTDDCELKIPYITLYGYLRWNFLPGKYKSWLGGGAGYLIPNSPSSTIFDKSQLTSNLLYVLAIGTDIRLSNKNYVPVSLEYGTFPTTSTVKANILFLRLGYAWNL